MAFLLSLTRVFWLSCTKMMVMLMLPLLSLLMFLNYWNIVGFRFR